MDENKEILLKIFVGGIGMGAGLVLIGTGIKQLVEKGKTEDEIEQD